MTLLSSGLPAAVCELITDEDGLTEREKECVRVCVCVLDRVPVDSHYSHHLVQITSRSSARLERIADIIDYLRSINRITTPPSSCYFVLSLSEISPCRVDPAVAGFYRIYLCETADF